MTRDEMIAAAQKLLNNLTLMAATGDFYGSGDHVLIKSTMFQLEPVLSQLGHSATFSTRGTPPRLWLPPLKETLESVLAFLTMHPEWEPTTAIPPAPADWMHAGLWGHIRAPVETAKKSGSPAHWETVSREAVVFFENELRGRSGLSPHDRQSLAAAAFKKGVGPLRLGDDEYQQGAWRMLAQGLLIATGNMVAHTLKGHEQSYAMGIAGAVSLLLTALDEAHPSS